MSLIEPNHFRLLSQQRPQRGPTSLGLTWDTQADAARYVLTFTNGRLKTTMVFLGPPATVSGLKSNRGYLFSLAAESDQGDVSPAATLKAVTCLPRPPAPTATLLGVSSGAPVRIAWDAKSLDYDATYPARVQIVRPQPDGGSLIVADDQALAGETLDYGATGSVQYVLRLIARHPMASGESNDSEFGDAASIVSAAVAGPTSVLGMPGVGLSTMFRPQRP